MFSDKNVHDLRFPKGRIMIERVEESDGYPERIHIGWRYDGAPVAKVIEFPKEVFEALTDFIKEPVSF